MLSIDHPSDESLTIYLMNLRKEGFSPVRVFGYWNHIGPSIHSFTSPNKVNSMVFHVYRV
jgi:hypothetical protein